VPRVRACCSRGSLGQVCLVQLEARSEDAASDQRAQLAVSSTNISSGPPV
jgi:hypothetical protein